MYGKNILLLIPHPDDEVVGCAAAIQRAVAMGNNVFGMYLTHGCIAKETLWSWQRDDYEKKLALRLGEARQAAEILGITPLSFSQERAARQLWPSLSGILEEVRVAIRKNRIDRLWVPAYEGGNPDHDGLNALSSVLRLFCQVWEFAEYNYSGGKAHLNQFPKENGTEQVLELAAEEKAIKKMAMKVYGSEKGNLSGLGVRQECFRPLAAYDYSQPPHEGKLWYARYQWVPFRHPRVDFTKPEEVSTAIASFRSSINA